LVGVFWAFGRRYITKPYRIRIKSKPEHAVGLFVLAFIGVTGHLTEMFRIAADGMPDHERWSVVGYPLATLVENLDSVHGWHQVMWIAHALGFVAFLAILPVTMLRHMFTSPLNMYYKERE